MPVKKTKVPVPDNPNNSETLQGFAKAVEERLKKSNLGPFATQRLVCRMMTKAGPNQARMIEKYVEWRYGKSPEKHQHEGGLEITVKHIGSGDTTPTEAE